VDAHGGQVGTEGLLHGTADTVLQHGAPAPGSPDEVTGVSVDSPAPEADDGSGELTADRCVTVGSVAPLQPALVRVGHPVRNGSGVGIEAFPQTLDHGVGHPVGLTFGGVVHRADDQLGLELTVDQAVDHLVAGSGLQFEERLDVAPAHRRGGRRRPLAGAVRFCLTSCASHVERLP